MRALHSSSRGATLAVGPRGPGFSEGTRAPSLTLSSPERTERRVAWRASRGRERMAVVSMIGSLAGVRGEEPFPPHILVIPRWLEDCIVSSLPLPGSSALRFPSSTVKPSYQVPGLVARIRSAPVGALGLCLELLGALECPLKIRCVHSMELRELVPDCLDAVAAVEGVEEHANCVVKYLVVSHANLCMVLRARAKRSVRSRAGSMLQGQASLRDPSQDLAAGPRDRRGRRGSGAPKG